MAVPALCDSLATTLMNVGLTLTHVSVFQMLRGSVVIFTGLLSVLFLNSKLYAFHWTGMFLVLLGLGCVGLASVLNADEGDAGAKNPLLGDALVIAAQVIVSIQMVVEQKFVGAHNVPALLAVGLEGVFGCLIMITALVALYYIPGDSAGNHAENIIDAGYQMSQNPVILLAVLGNVFSIAFFNYFGISVTKEMDATTRMVLDSLRTFTIWAVSLLIGWETFQGVQVIGFAILLFGTCVYNKIVVFDFLMTEYNADRMSDDGMIQSNDAKRISMKESLLDNQMDSDDFAMSMPAPALMRTDSPMYTKDVNMHPGSGNV